MLKMCGTQNLWLTWCWQPLLAFVLLKFSRDISEAFWRKPTQVPSLISFYSARDEVASRSRVCEHLLIILRSVLHAPLPLVFCIHLRTMAACEAKVGQKLVLKKKGESFFFCSFFHSLPRICTSFLDLAVTH